ncbi:MAG: heavy metal translocating P-type ATPase [Acidobacteriota bacterium]
MSVQKSVYLVEDMCCADEQRVIEKRLRAMEGIESYSFNLVARKLYITHTRSDAEIREALKTAGFDSCPLHTEKTAPLSDRSVHYGKPAGLMDFLRTHGETLVSLVLAALGIALDHSGAGQTASHAVLALAILAGGRKTARRAVSALRTFTFDMNVLMSAAVVGALILGKWEEGAAVIALYALSQLLEEAAMRRTRRAISTLLESAPRTASVLKEGNETTVALEELRPGDVVKIRPGEKIPADGTVRSGRSTVDQSAITGESLPAEKIPGSMVYAGTLNARGTLEVTVSRTGPDTTMAQIIHLVEKAQTERAPSQRFIDRFASVYSPSVMGLAIAIALLPPLLFGASFTLWFYRALVLLVIACPCALVISTPVTIISGLTSAARRGILIKGGRVLEEAGRIRAVAFDKTGTLTYGTPTVTDIVAVNGLNEQALVHIAALGEQHSEHVLADAIVRKASEMGIAFGEEEVAFEAVPGKGIVMTIDGTPYAVGSRAFLESQGVGFSEISARLEDFEREGKTVIALGSGTKLLGAIAVADLVRHESREAFPSLASSGLIEHTVLLSGDNPKAAGAVAYALGIREAIGELLPHEKVEEVKRLRERYGSVAMVGDGINDAPALAAATVGIAMGGTASDAAMETADVVLMHNDLRSVETLIGISRRTMRMLKQNVAIALCAKAVFLVLGLLGMATLWMAVVADDGVTLLVVANSLRLLRMPARPLS